MWMPQIDALKDSFHIVAPDLPGLGRSKDLGPFSIRGNHIKAAAREDAMSTGKDGFLSAVRSASGVDFRSSLPDVRVPTTVACGANDRPNLRASKEMAAKIPGARLEIISEAGHVWNLEKPEQFNLLIRETVRAGFPEN